MKRKSKGSASVVIASKTPELDRNKELAAYQCGDCNGRLVVQASLKPFCTHCGGQELSSVDLDDADQDILETEDDELSFVSCSSCRVGLIMSDKTALAHNGDIHCAACGTATAYAVSELSGEDETDEDWDQADDLTDEDLESASDEESEEDDLDDVVVSKVKGRKKSKSKARKALASDEDDASAPANEDLDGSGIPAITEIVANLEDYADGDVEFVKAGNKVLCFMGSTCVASVNIEDSTDPEFLEGKGAIEALATAAASEDLNETLAKYGFQKASVTIPVDRLITDQVEAKLKEQAEALNTKADQQTASLREDVSWALATAGAGLSKGFFSDVENPVHTLLPKILEQAGCGEQEIAQVISQFSCEVADAYNLALTDVAFDLIGQPAEVRNELAKTIVRANYSRPGIESAGVKDSLTARLQNGLVGKKPDRVIASNKGQDNPRGLKVVELAKTAGFGHFPRN